MVNAFSEITNYDGDYNDVFDKYAFMGIFMPILEEYKGQPKLSAKIIKYIVYAFSIESPRITISGDVRKETGDIFRWLNIDEGRSKDDSLYKAVVLLESSLFLTCVNNWLKFQDNRSIEYLFTLRQQYAQQQTASLSMIKKSTLEIDWDQKMKCIEHLALLKQMLKEAEAELYQNSPKLKAAYEFTAAANRKTTTIGSESFVAK